ncbi:MAG: DNA repair protein RecO [Candidatus Omnitrophica bacterium]|nr:DNA repair protein RecO [Candidatus Omnitrophota bacterium]
MAIQKTEAIVLKTMPFRSTSLIVTFYTREFGKIKGIVKGVRQEGEMRGSLYELFSRVEIIYYEKLKSDLHLVSEGSLLESYASLREDLRRIATASYFVELVEELTEFYDPHRPIFDLLDLSFRYLASISFEKIAAIFEIHLLSEIGLLPFLEACLGCEKQVPEEGFFSIRQGGLLCEDCARKMAQDAKPIEAQTLACMRYFVKHDFEISLKKSTPAYGLAPFRSIIRQFIADRHSRPFKSLQFLEKIRPVLSI